jgi:S1-C subfamily serine protease
VTTSFENQTEKQEAKRKVFHTPWPVVAAFSVVTSFFAGHMLWPGNGLFSSDAPILVRPHSITAAPATPTLPVQLGENPIADIVAAAGPAVVNIDTTMEMKEKAPDIKLPSFFPKANPFEGFRNKRFEAHGSGSGVIIRADGYILTNNHVVKGVDQIKVTLNDERTFVGRVIGSDTYSDVALVKIDGNNLPIAKLGTSKNLRPGDWAIAIGSPLGLNHTVTMGIISALGRSLGDLNNNVEMIQTDAAINPGNSGGPLLNIHGEVIGINQAIRTDAQNIGFSIPIDIAKEVAFSLLSKTPILRPYLGVSMIDFDAQLASNIGVPSSVEGVLVAKVATDSPAATSGITAGDIIERVDDKVVKSGRDVQKVVRSHKVGNGVTMDIYRNGATRKVTVKLTAYPQKDADS